MTKRRLTKQQKNRIGAIQEKRRQRANNRTSELDTLGNLTPEQTGTIISQRGTSVIVEDNSNNLIRCTVRQNLASLVCGDKVVWQAIDGQESASQNGIVIALHPRKTLLARPLPNGEIKSVAANIDQIIIMAAILPVLSESLIDRYLVSAEVTGIQPTILINKIDLLNKDEINTLKKSLSVYTEIGYTVLFSSVKEETGLDALSEQLNRKTSILVGQSGVGKSSLVKRLLPEKEITIGRLSQSLQGKHTTTTSELYHLPCGGNLIDSPGVRDFGVWQLDKRKIAQGFIEFREYLGKCKFRNCSHTNDPQCALKEAVEVGEINPRRLESYLGIIQAID